MHVLYFVTLGLLGTLVTAATLPLILEVFLVTFAHLLPRGDLASTTGPVPAIAVIVPAHNEELLITRCVDSLRTAATERTRILVVAHNCTDRTAARAREAGAEVLVLNDPHASGKGFALRYGFEQALARNAEAVLVVDADSTVSPTLIATVERALADWAEVVQCNYTMTSTTSRANSRLAALAFRGFNSVRPDGRERLGLSCGILGNGFAIRASVLRAISYDALSVVEDLEYHIHLVMAGRRVHYLHDALITAELPSSTQGEATQRARWEGGRLNAARRWSGPLLASVLRGRMRLIEPFFEVSSLPLAYGAFLLALGVAVGLIPGLVIPGLVPGLPRLIPIVAVALAWLWIYSVAGIVILVVHVLTAAWLGPNRWGTLCLLTMAPFYVLWKIRLVPGLLRGSKKRAAWIRTERDSNLSDIAEEQVTTAQ